MLANLRGIYSLVVQRFALMQLCELAENRFLQGFSCAYSAPLSHTPGHHEPGSSTVASGSTQHYLRAVTPWTVVRRVVSMRKLLQNQGANTSSAWASGFGLGLDSIEASSWNPMGFPEMNTHLRVRRLGFKT